MRHNKVTLFTCAAVGAGAISGQFTAVGVVAAPVDDLLQLLPSGLEFVQLVRELIELLPRREASGWSLTDSNKKFC